MLRLAAFIAVGNTFNFVFRNLCLHQLLIIFTACEDRLTIVASDILIAVLCGADTKLIGVSLSTRRCIRRFQAVQPSGPNQFSAA
jgi:hypothetical protein